MKRKWYTEPQIVLALQQAEVGTPVAEICRKMGVAEAAFCRRKKHSGRWMPTSHGGGQGSNDTAQTTQRQRQ